MGNNSSKGVFGYSRNGKLLWKNMDRFYSLRGTTIDSTGNSYANSYDILDLKSGLIKKSPLKFTSGAISNNDYIYGTKEKNSSYFMTKINTKNKTILDIPIKCKGYYSLIDADKNILLPSNNCVQRLSSSGKILAFHDEFSEEPHKKYSVLQIAPNGNTIGVNYASMSGISPIEIIVSFDKNFNFLWSRAIHGVGTYSIA